MNERYLRNIGSIITAEDQQQLLQKTVLLIGCGGVGGYEAELLVRLGIRKLIFFDGDSFEQTNLNRQLGCGYPTIGKNKAAVLSEYLSSFSDVELVAYPHYFGSEPADAEVFDNHSVDYIVWAADKGAFTGEALSLVKSALERNVPVFTAGAMPCGIGCVTFTAEDMAVFNSFFFEKWETSSETSVPAYLCSLAAGFLVKEIVRFLHDGRASYGQELQYDARDDKIHKFDFAFGQLC